MSDERKHIEESTILAEWDGKECYITLADFRAALDDAIAEYGDGGDLEITAQIDSGWEPGDETVTIFLAYATTRPETDEEMAERLEVERIERAGKEMREQIMADKVRAQELLTLRRLRAKYGDDA